MGVTSLGPNFCPFVASEYMHTSSFVFLSIKATLQLLLQQLETSKQLLIMAVAMIVCENLLKFHVLL